MGNESIHRKIQITQVAESLFNDKGYSATSMRDLAREVGIEAASLYNHYKSKEEILHSICFGIAEQFFNAMDQIPNSKLNSKDQLLLAINEHINVIVKNIDASRVFFLEWKHLSKESLREFKVMRKKYEAIFSDIVQKGIDNGEFRKSDVKITVFTILSSLNAIYDLYKPYGKQRREEIAEGISNIIISGLLKR